MSVSFGGTGVMSVFFAQKACTNLLFLLTKKAPLNVFFHKCFLRYEIIKSKKKIKHHLLNGLTGVPQLQGKVFSQSASYYERFDKN